jgi:hypothetical protein
MHLAGLAVDLAYRANPWVGSLSFKTVSGRAATLVGGSETDAAGRRTRKAAAVGELSDAPGLGRRALHQLSQGPLTTSQIYDALVQWNTWLEQYLALGADDRALASAIAARQADGTPGIVRPGATPDRTLADWRRQIAVDLDSLRRNSFSAAGTPRDPRKGFLSFHRDLVVALRDVACLAWGAVDLGASERGSGDMMHFDCRVEGIGRAYGRASGGNVPQRHPCITAPEAQRELAPVMEAELKTQPTPAGITGKLFRLDSRQGGSATGVFVPPAAMTSAPFKVLLWMHGLSRRRRDTAECKNATFAAKPDCFPFICGNADDAFQHLKDSTFSLMKLVEASGKPFILVVPSMSWSGDSHKLETPKQMNLFLKEVQTFLENVRVWLKDNGKVGWAEKSVIGQLVLAGHSKAYVVLDGLARRVDDAESSQDPLAKLSDVWSLDTMYKSRAHEKWVKWATRKPGVKFRVFYRPCSPTGPEGDCLTHKAIAAGLDKKNLKVIAITTTTHCDLPAQQLPSLLATGEPAVAVQKEVGPFEAEETDPQQQYDTPSRKTPPSPPVVDPPGKTLYVDAPVHPKPVESKVGVFLPERFRPSASVDLLVFLHGHLGPCASPRPSVAEFWNTGLAKPGAAMGIGPMGLREELNLAGKNVILVVPSLGAFSSAGALTAPGGFDALIANVLQVIRDEASLKITPSLVRHIVLAGHSGGGAAMRDIVALKDHAVRRIRRVWGFDTLNSDRDPKAWLEWAKAEPDPSLRRVFQYYADTWADAKKTIKVGTWRRAEELAKLADIEGLKNVHAKKAGGRKHCELPLLFLKDRLKATTFFDTI